MFAKDCIENSLPYLRSTDTVAIALDLMLEAKLKALPIVQKDKLLGVISENVLLEYDDDKTIKSLKDFYINVSVAEGTHGFEVIRLMGLHRIDTLPVIAENQHYIGQVTATSIVFAMNTATSIAEEGGMLILEMRNNDYALTEIAKIVESNNASILHAYVSSLKDVNKIQVTLKINRTDLKDIIQTFERFNYEVVGVMQKSSHEEDLKDRLDSLFNYLNV